MAVVLRLQGLSANADIEDIRRFFEGLLIPKGGVHITGGTTGEAFVVFSTERDGQLALHRSGSLLHGAEVMLYLSSMAEMTETMKSTLRKRKHSGVKSETTPPSAIPTDRHTALQNLSAFIQGFQTNFQVNAGQLLREVISALPSPEQETNYEMQKKQTTESVKEKTVEPIKLQDGKNKREGNTSNSSKPGYLRLYGLPDSITKDEVCQFFEGQSAVNIIPNAFQGAEQCCLVKMASFEEAEEVLKNNHCIKDFGVKVRLAHMRMWTDALEQQEHIQSSMAQDRISPENTSVKRLQSPSGSPSKRHRAKSPTFATEFCVMIKNLPVHSTKTEIKEMFSCQNLSSQKVLHLLDKQNHRTSTAFIIFTKPEEYTMAMNMNGNFIGSRKIEVSSITKAKMQDLIYESRYGHLKPAQSVSSSTESSRFCIYARNLPAHVKKAEVKDFFRDYKISEDEVTLLYDGNGNGIGEAIIQFSSKKSARKAHSLHGKSFKGEKVLLTRITPEQTKDLLVKTQ